MSDERNKLVLFISELSYEMLLKLFQQMDRGYGGWDDPGSRPRVQLLFTDHVERAAHDPRQWLDVAILAAMLWWHGKRTWNDPK